MSVPADHDAALAARRQALRQIAEGLERLDREVYAAEGADPLEPILGEGDRRARVCILGRDPGRHEVRHRQPFVGAGGQKVRAALHRVVRGVELPDFEASLDVGEAAFWCNTVPYKPHRNKAWRKPVREACRPWITWTLVERWDGTDVLALGRVAFDWFGHDRPTRARLKAHWAREDRFDVPVEVALTAPSGRTRTLRVQPLPHPSPLNATWAPHVPRLLEAALRRAGLAEGRWRLDD